MLSLFHWLGPHDLTHPRQHTYLAVLNEKSSSKEEGWDKDKRLKKETKKGYKARELQQITCSHSGKGKKNPHRNVLLCVLFWSHVINSLSHCQGEPRLHQIDIHGSSVHQIQVTLLCKMCQGDALYMYIEYIYRTRTCHASLDPEILPEILLLTHSQCACVCECVFPISFSRQLWKLFYCLHSNRKGSGKCLMRGGVVKGIGQLNWVT